MRISLFSVVDHYADGPRDKLRLYGEIVDQAVLADRLGYDTVWCAEHHFVDYGIVPNPAVLLSHVAARTSRVRLGPAVSILPFRDPRLVAEDYAMLDMLSGGRAVLGVGSGYVPPEYAGFGLDFADKHLRFNEALGIIRRLLAGEKITVDGKFTRLKDVRLNVGPVQAKLPVAVATGRKDAVRAVGAQGDNLMFMAYTMCNKVAEAAEAVREYRQGRVDGGHVPAAGTVGVGFHTHVGETDADARDGALAAFDRYCETRLKARKRAYGEACDDGVVLFGSPERVADQIVALHKMGVDEILTLHNFGLMPSAAVEASMRRLASEVMPIVRARLAEAAAAA